MPSAIDLVRAEREQISDDGLDDALGELPTVSFNWPTCAPS